MPGSKSGIYAVAVFAGCLAAGAAAAQVTAGQRSSDLEPGASLYGDPAVPDISGLWLGSVIGVPGKGAVTNTGKSTDGRPPTFLAPWPLPYTAEYQKKADEQTEGARKGRTVGDLGARCLPFGLPMMMMLKVYPEEVVQTPGEVTMFLWGAFPITIWTDGRPHPKDWTPTYNGHSIGYWEGDTLHVDTVGINGLTTFAAGLYPHSPSMHIKWTVERVAKDVTHADITFYDAAAFTEPVSTTSIRHRMPMPRWEVLDDNSCFEGVSNVADKPVAPGFVKY